MDFDKVKILLILSVLFYLDNPMYSQSYYKGTAIAIYKTPDSILVAADRKVTRVESTLDGVKYIDSGMKIRKIFDCGRFWFTSAGFVMDDNNNFNLITFIDSLKKIELSVDEAILKVNNLVETRLINIWNKVSHNILPELCLQVAFFRFIDNKPFVCRIKYFPILDTASSRVTVKVESVIGAESDYGVYLLGSTKGIIDAMHWETNKYDSFSDVAIKTIETAIDHYPDIVGGPIDLLVITKNDHYLKTKNYP
jgi:hypothetical protein